MTTDTTIIGQEYNVIEPDEFPPGTGEPESVVPIGHDDTGNLRVDQYEDGDHQTVLWNEDGFTELMDDGVIEHA